MRVYIIGSDGITLCREAPTVVNDGEIAVASNEELHAAPLSGKRLLALWNALPGVEKRQKVGDRNALIDQLWSAIECDKIRTNAPEEAFRSGVGSPKSKANSSSGAGRAMQDGFVFQAWRCLR